MHSISLHSWASVACPCLLLLLWLSALTTLSLSMWWSYCFDFGAYCIKFHLAISCLNWVCRLSFLVWAFHSPRLTKLSMCRVHLMMAREVHYFYTYHNSKILGYFCVWLWRTTCVARLSSSSTRSWDVLQMACRRSMWLNWNYRHHRHLLLHRLQHQNFLQLLLKFNVNRNLATFFKRICTIFMILKEKTTMTY